jgi:hypothetical protein
MALGQGDPAPSRRLALALVDKDDLAHFDCAQRLRLTQRITHISCLEDRLDFESNEELSRL